MKKTIFTFLFIVINAIVYCQSTYQSFYKNYIQVTIANFTKFIEIENKKMNPDEIAYVYYVVYINSVDTDLLNYRYNVVNLEYKSALNFIFEKIFYYDQLGGRKIFIGFENDDTVLINRFNFLPKVTQDVIDKVNDVPMFYYVHDNSIFCEKIDGRETVTYYSTLQGMTKRNFYSTIYPLYFEKLNRTEHRDNRTIVEFIDGILFFK